MKNFAKPTAFEIVENHDYNGHHLRIGEVVVIEGVVNPEEENREKSGRGRRREGGCKAQAEENGCSGKGRCGKSW